MVPSCGKGQIGVRVSVAAQFCGRLGSSEFIRLDSTKICRLEADTFDNDTLLKMSWAPVELLMTCISAQIEQQRTTTYFSNGDPFQKVMDVAKSAEKMRS